ncbi:MAG: DUF4147 domain-containing protein [Candidatus Pacebacteria bacterium]|nr:DUF4147 domain-containing protein [Candidatus Paceibacterota bacterium]
MNIESERMIKNFDTLATTPGRTSLLTIVEAGLQAIQTPQVIRDAVQLAGDVLTVQGIAYNLHEYENLYVLGVGKCAVDAARELEQLLGERITEGVVVDVRQAEGLRRVRAYQGTHPYSSAQNAEYTRHLLDVAQKAGEHDLVLMIVSGGGSALLCQPETHTAVQEATLVEHLFKGGATIEDLNTVRKHLSKARGGHLATAAYPAEVVVLIFSDVPGNDLHTISSGPTVLDTTTLRDAKAIFEKYHVERCGFSDSHLIETPKVPAMFEHVHNLLVLTNETALTAMRVRAEDLGYTAFIRDTALRGEAREVATLIVEELHTAKPRTVLLYGGETTVTITGPGKGGRNEELALSALSILRNDEILTSVASDGRDNTDLAGGVADSTTRLFAEEQGRKPEDYLYTNDSFSFFHTLQQGIETGYTGANVADLVIAMKHG